MKIPDVGGWVLWTLLYICILLLFWFLMIFARIAFIKIIFIRIFFVETGVLTFFFLWNGHTIMTRTYVFSRLIVFTLFSDFFFSFFARHAQFVCAYHNETRCCAGKVNMLPLDCRIYIFRKNWNRSDIVYSR